MNSFKYQIISLDRTVDEFAQRAHDTIMTSLWHQNDVAKATLLLRRVSAGEELMPTAMDQLRHSTDIIRHLQTMSVRDGGI